MKLCTCLPYKVYNCEVLWMIWFISGMIELSLIMYIFKWLCNYVVIMLQIIKLQSVLQLMSFEEMAPYFAFDYLACIQDITFLLNCCPHLRFRDFHNWREWIGGKVMLPVVRATVSPLQVMFVCRPLLVDLCCHAGNLLMHLAQDMAFWIIHYMLLVAISDGVWSRMLRKM